MGGELAIEGFSPGYAGDVFIDVHAVAGAGFRSHYMVLPGLPADRRDTDNDGDPDMTDPDDDGDGHPDSAITSRTERRAGSGQSLVKCGQAMGRLGALRIAVWRRVLLGAWLGAASMAGGAAESASSSATSAAGANAVDRRVPVTLEVRNRRAAPATDIAVGVFLPVASAVGQRCCQQIEASQPYELLADSAGNRAVRFRLDPLPPHALHVLRLTVTLSHRPEAQPAMGVRNDVRGGAIQPLLAAEPLIEVDAEPIRRVAARLMGPTEADTARNINAWVGDYLSYSGYRRSAPGALAALDEGRGDCTDFMHLFIALARAAGLPARGMAGYVLRPGERPTAAGLHNWAEVRVEDRWLIADAQRGVLGNGGGRYLATRVLGGVAEAPWPPDAVRFWVEGDGVSVRMP